MDRSWRVFGRWLALAGLVLCVPAWAADAGKPAPEAGRLLLEQTESLRTADHEKFLEGLQQLHAQAAHLTPAEHWHLRYLDAWQAAYQGDYAAAEASLKQIVDHTKGTTLGVKASTLLMDVMGLSGNYAQAFVLANRLASDLPAIKDDQARYRVLHDLSQLLGSAGQHALAISYAREMERVRPPGESACKPRAILLAALYESHTLKSSSPEFPVGIQACQGGDEPVHANTLWLIMGSTYLDEGQPRQVLALLGRIGPSIQTNQYSSHILTYKVLLAQAHAALGQDADARQAALAALAFSEQSGVTDNVSLRDIYDVLYRVEKKQGDANAALSYYEQYVAQNKGNIDDITARALAYDAAQQSMLSQRLQTERLSKQNSVLRLQQALSAKAVEASRLYLAMLLLLLGGIVLWLVRLKRSQMRFRKMASHDGLTGIFNHQYFFAQASRALGVIQKKAGSACLVSIDLDHFKRVNDTYGHAAGDAVLKHAVQVCQAQLRPGDLFGRLGGEEFGVLLPDCPQEQGLEIAHRIREAIASSPLTLNGVVIAVSASVGLACTEVSGYDLQKLCSDADTALYSAKRGGRNRVAAGSDAGQGVTA